jgi:endo-1,3-1,4-beta-glycanase ExoK
LTYLARSPRHLAVSVPCLSLAVLIFGMLAPRAASAVQGAELYRTQPYFYGRFEARLRFAPGEGVVSSFFLWKDGSSSTTTWNELDFEKINSTCHLQTNIWTGKGTQSAQLNTPTFNICSEYHTYAFEWTPDYIAWLIDGTQIRKVTGANVTEYTQNASKGMGIHFNVWEGDASFGGTLNPSVLPVHQYISWVQYSSYANGAFQQQWREDFNASTIPSGWATGNWASPNNLSTHNPANVTYGNGIAVLSLTADGATGFPGTPPADPADSGTGGSSATGGSPGTGGSSATGGSPGTGGAAGKSGTTGTGGAAATGGSTGTGGTTATGTGGTPGGGGRSATGGTPGAGGGSATGGATGAGGASTTGSGGVVGSGGALGTGGGVATGGASAEGGSLGTGGASASGSGGAPSDNGPGQTGSGSGCACRISDHGAPSERGLSALLLVAACLLRRRPRPRTTAKPKRS